MAPDWSDYSVIAFSPVTSETELPETWIWTGWMPEIGTVMVDGESGTGKSRGVASALYHADGKGLMPDGSQSEIAVTSVLHVSGEMSLRQVRSVWEAQGWSRDWMKHNLRIMNRIENKKTGKEEEFYINREEHRAAFKKLVKAFKCNVVVIDPFLEFFLGDENSAQTARHLVRIVQDLAEELRILIIIICHWNKNEEAGMKNRVSGSHQFDATVRSRISIERIKNNEDRRAWVLTKALEGNQPRLAFEIDEYGKTDWVGGGPPKHSIAEVTSWLLGRLGDRQDHFFEEIKADALKLGYDRHQVAKAKMRLHDKVEKDFQQLGAVQRQVWRLKQ